MIAYDILYVSKYKTILFNFLLRLPSPSQLINAQKDEKRIQYQSFRVVGVNSYSNEIIRLNKVVARTT